jgi:hypothetical protein
MAAIIGMIGFRGLTGATEVIEQVVTTEVGAGGSLTEIGLTGIARIEIVWIEIGTVIATGVEIIPTEIGDRPQIEIQPTDKTVRQICPGVLFARIPRVEAV